MNLWHDVKKELIEPTNFISVIEIPKGSKCKYELDKQTGAIKLDRVLSTSTAYPHNYGFIPLSLSCDGDPIDVLVLCSEEVVPLTLIESRPIGVVFMKDGKDEDEKIIAVATKDPFYNTFTDINQLPKHVLLEITHFFTVYKQLENKYTSIEDIKGKQEAVKIIEEALIRYQSKFKN